MMTLLIIFASQSVFAFVITPPQPGATVIYDAEEEYNLGGGVTGVTRLNPLSVTSIQRGGTAGFLDQLRAEFTAAEGWTFLAAAQDLAGSFNITHYDAVSPTTDPGRVGANFAFDYNRAGTDPMTAGTTVLHWIQRVVDNHNITNNPGHDNPENVIDFLSPSGTQTRPDVPFYDVLPTGDPLFDIPPFAVPPHFEDGTRRTDPNRSHTWMAEVYLVSLQTDAPKRVTIYNGASWGWENHVIPEPSSLLLFAVGIIGTALYGWRKRKIAA